jgi:hypothetical protein
MPGLIWVGPADEGRISISKIAVGMYTVEHELGMCTPPIVTDNFLLSEFLGGI